MSTCGPVVAFSGKYSICFIMSGYNGMFARRIQSLRSPKRQSLFAFALGGFYGKPAKFTGRCLVK
jgi:hypothetical protein